MTESGLACIDTQSGFDLEPLSAVERERLNHYEYVVDDTLAKIQEGREALIAIRDQRLYREYTDEEGRRLTFEGYCEWRFGITRAYAYRLIEFHRIRENLSPRGDILPATEKQARPLTKLEPEDQAEAWTRAQEETGKAQPSATEVAKVVAELEKERLARTAAEQRSEEWRKQWKDERDKAQDLQTQLFNQKKQEPERIEVAPPDYEALKDASAKLTAEIATLEEKVAKAEAAHEKEANRLLKIKLGERQQELDRLEKRREEVEAAVQDSEERRRRQSSADASRRHQQKIIEAVTKACGTFASEVAVAEWETEDLLCGQWEKTANFFRDMASIADFLANKRALPDQL